jgi:hypothetical protein
MGDIDAAGEGMDVRMQMALDLEKAHAAGEDDIRAGKQGLLKPDSFRRRAAERRKLVHAVVHDQRGADVVGKLQCQWCEVVQEGSPYPLGREQPVEQSLLCRIRLGPGKGIRHARHHDLDPALDGMRFEPGLDRVCGDRLLDKEHPVRPSKTRHQMLRTLVDEVPTEMREANQSGRRRR